LALFINFISLYWIDLFLYVPLYLKVSIIKLIKLMILLRHLGCLGIIGGKILEEGDYFPITNKIVVN